MDDVIAVRRRYSAYALRTCAVHMRPLFEVVHDLGVNLTIVVSNSGAFFDTDHAWVAIVSDAIDSHGPANFDPLSLGFAFEGSGLIMIVSAPPNPLPYAFVADFVRTTGCCATVVETEMSREIVWAAAALAANPHIQIRYYTPAVLGSA